MKIQVVIVSFGEEYLSLLVNFTLKSLDIEKYRKYFHIVLITGSKLDGSLNKLFNKVIIVDTPKNYINFQSNIIRKFHKNSFYEYNMFLSPDTIWSKDSLKIILEDIENSSKLSFIHYRRTDNIILKNETFSYPIETYDLYKLSRKYTHKLHYAHNLKTSNSTMWPEYYYINDNNSEINYIVNKEPLYIHKDICLDHHNQISYFPKNSIKIYGGTSDIFCASLAQSNKYQDWIDFNTRLTPKKISSWVRKHSLISSTENFRGIPIVWKASESSILNNNILN